MVPLFGSAYAAPNIGTTILYLFGSQRTLLNPPVNGKIKGLANAFKCFKYFSRQGLFKTVLYIQVLFKPVRTLKSKLTYEQVLFMRFWYLSHMRRFTIHIVESSKFSKS